MPPLGDERDEASARDWGLGPPIHGAFGRTVIWELTVLLAPISVALAVAQILFPAGFAHYRTWVVLTVAAGGVLSAFNAVVLRNPGGVATVVQVGVKGVGLGRTGVVSRRLLRSRWIPWSELRLDPVGFGDRWGHTLHIYNGEDDGTPQLIDYNQARQILIYPSSAGALTSYPYWLQARLGLPPGSVKTRDWGERDATDPIHFG